MQTRRSFLTPAVELFWVQLSWTLWAAGIMLAVNIVQMIFRSDAQSYYSMGYVSGNIYMLVIGIIVVNFMSHYVGYGVTRRHYFVGGLVASLGLSLVIPKLVYIINFVQKFVIGNFTSVVLNDNKLEEIAIEINDDLISALIEANILKPFIQPDENLIFSLAIFSLNLFVFYIIGWMIGIAFYRLGVIGGLFSIVLSLALITMKDTMLRVVLDVPLAISQLSSLADVASPLAWLLIVAVICVTIGIVYALTRKAPIRI